MFTHTREPSFLMHRRSTRAVSGVASRRRYVKAACVSK